VTIHSSEGQLNPAAGLCAAVTESVTAMASESLTGPSTRAIEGHSAEKVASGCLQGYIPPKVMFINRPKQYTFLTVKTIQGTPTKINPGKQAINLQSSG